jgi:RNA polymerase sigma-70 factor (ECF subfamily)
MDDRAPLTERFEAHRSHLKRVAYRMLGSRSEAEDAVQEAWLRLSRADTTGVENLGAWLTTVVARVCLDMLRSRKSRREEPLEQDADASEPVASTGSPSPAQDIELADSIGLALLVVLETLSPAERVAFVLHDMFDLPFEDIAPIVGRSLAATRQLASRARRRIQGASPTSRPDPVRRREIVGAFLAASRGGDFAALLALLDPNVVLRADRSAVAFGAEVEVKGAEPVAKTFAGRARAAQPALVNGEAALVWAPGGQPRVALSFTFAGERIASIELIADKERIQGVDLTILPG